MIMAMMLDMLTIKMIFMSSMWSASMSICSNAYVADFLHFHSTTFWPDLLEILLTGWSEGAYYVDQDDLPHLHLENLQIHHLTRIRLHYNHMTLETLWSQVKSGPDATFWERDEWELGHSGKSNISFTPAFTESSKNTTRQVLLLLSLQNISTLARLHTSKQKSLIFHILYQNLASAGLNNNQTTSMWQTDGLWLKTTYDSVQGHLDNFMACLLLLKQGCLNMWVHSVIWELLH